MFGRSSSMWSHHARAMGIFGPEQEVGAKTEQVVELDRYRMKKAVHS